MTVTGGTVEKLPVVIFMKLCSFLEEASHKFLEFLYLASILKSS
jgi:hypothetical protein